jgi:hypothetical protein
MKCTTILIFFLVSTSLWARDDRQILKCLGEEEKRFHLKKETGPVYELNQRLIGELIQIPKVEINPQDYYLICSGEKFSESWKLLELSIKKGKNLFIIPKEVSGIQRSMTEGMIDDYVEATREILLGFIAQIQSIAPSPTCLKDEIPELDNFFTEIKYLQEDVEMKTLFEGKDEKIFDRLKNYSLAFEKCRARLKKKAKSGSSARPKKS